MESFMLTWSDQYLIGHERIDFEHKIFFGLIQDFQNAHLLNRDNKQLINILNEIALYAKFHFRSEENIMENMRYPGLMEHKIQHYNLVEVLSNKMMGFEMGVYTPEQVIEFLVEWFFNHSQTHDKNIVEYQHKMEEALSDPTFHL